MLLHQQLLLLEEIDVVVMMLLPGSRMMQLVLGRQRAWGAADGYLGFGRAGRTHGGRTEHLTNWSRYTLALTHSHTHTRAHTEVLCLCLVNKYLEYA